MRNSGTTVYDEWGANNGTATNSPTFATSAGVVGAGAGVVGEYTSTGSYKGVVIGNPAALQINSESSGVTISAWVKLATVPSGGTQYGAIAGAGYLTAVNGYGLSVDQTNWRFQARVGATVITAVSAHGSSAAWTHVAGVRTGGNCIIYVNGSTTASASGALGDTTPTAQWSIGMRDVGTGTFAYGLNGAIDEVRIYNRALSLDEIKQLYRMGKTIYQNR